MDVVWICAWLPAAPLSPQPQHHLPGLGGIFWGAEQRGSHFYPCPGWDQPRFRGFEEESAGMMSRGKARL